MVVVDGAKAMVSIGNLIWCRRRPRPVVVQWSLTAENLLKNFSVRTERRPNGRHVSIDIANRSPDAPNLRLILGSGGRQP